MPNEVVVVCHGVESDELVRSFPATENRQYVHVGPKVPFGAALDVGWRKASGDLVAKVDDDDIYSHAHLEDLVLAHLLSRADLVGKGAEFVLLEEDDYTIRRFVGGGYSFSRTIAGGAMAITRRAYELTGGWRPLSRHVDEAMINDVIVVGGKTFRTTGIGYVLVRHQDHTWSAERSRFNDQAEARWDGLPGWIIDDPLDL